MPARPVPAPEGFETLAEVKKRFDGFDAAWADAPPVVRERFITEVLLNSATTTPALNALIARLSSTQSTMTSCMGRWAMSNANGKSKKRTRGWLIDTTGVR